MILEVEDFNDMIETTYKIQDKTIQLHGNGLFSKEKVTVSISKGEKNTGIIFLLNNQKIYANIENVSNANRNTVLSNGTEVICLVEHFLAACSVLGVDDIEVTTDKNELVFSDGSALHWHDAFLKAGFCSEVFTKYELKVPIFIKDKDKEIVAIPHNGFKVSYFMDWDHPALGKLWGSWGPSEGKDTHLRLLKARTFATKEENDFFGVSGILLTLEKNSFDKKLHEPLEPVYHKILDIIGDLRLCGINPLEINMHVIGFKSGHMLNVQMARELKVSLRGGTKCRRSNPNLYM